MEQLERRIKQMSNGIARIREPFSDRERIGDLPQPLYPRSQTSRALDACNLALVEQNSQSSIGDPAKRARYPSAVCRRG